jgi:hypothetical protein
LPHSTRKPGVGTGVSGHRASCDRLSRRLIVSDLSEIIGGPRLCDPCDALEPEQRHIVPGRSGFDEIREDLAHDAAKFVAEMIHRLLSRTPVST